MAGAGPGRLEVDACDFVAKRAKGNGDVGPLAGLRKLLQEGQEIAARDRGVFRVDGAEPVVFIFAKELSGARFFCFVEKGIQMKALL